MTHPDRIEGAGKNIGGKAKEGVGKLTGDEKLKAEGKMDQAEGKVQNAVGGVKDALKGDKRH
ncbi:MAG: CsbD family protein [Brevundimonas sp.]